MPPLCSPAAPWSSVRFVPRSVRLLRLLVRSLLVPPALSQLARLGSSPMSLSRRLAAAARPRSASRRLRGARRDHGGRAPAPRVQVSLYLLVPERVTIGNKRTARAKQRGRDYRKPTKRAGRASRARNSRIAELTDDSEPVALGRREWILLGPGATGSGASPMKRSRLAAVAPAPAASRVRREGGGWPSAAEPRPQAAATATSASCQARRAGRGLAGRGDVTDEPNGGRIERTTKEQLESKGGASRPPDPPECGSSGGFNPFGRPVMFAARRARHSRSACPSSPP